MKCLPLWWCFLEFVLTCVANIFYPDLKGTFFSLIEFITFSAVKYRDSSCDKLLYLHRLLFSHCENIQSVIFTV